MGNDKDPRLEELETSTLPLSEREENPPLIVDLPDGQKLLVGDIKAGTVIEVATWRGTGRPDSRTQRFMLGISHDEPEGNVTASVVKDNVTEIQEVLVQSQPIAEQEVAVPQTPEINPQAVEPILEEPVVEAVTVIEPEIETQPVLEDAPIAGIMKNDSLTSRMDLLFGPTTQFGINNPANVQSTRPSRELVAPMKKISLKKKFNFRFKLSLKSPTFISLAAVVALIATLSALNISITHPKSGLATAMGEAKSAVMFVQAKKEYSVGESIVGDTSAKNGNPVFGVISAVGDGSYMLNGNNGYISVANDEVRGKVVAIAPWWGKLFNIFDK